MWMGKSRESLTGEEVTMAEKQDDRREQGGDELDPSATQERPPKKIDPPDENLEGSASFQKQKKGREGGVPENRNRWHTRWRS